MLTTTLLSYVNDWKAFKEAQEQSTAEAKRQKLYYDRKANAISLEPGDLVLAKANAYKGERKVKDRLEKEPYKVVHKVAEGIHSYLVKNEQMGCSQVIQWNRLFLFTPVKGTPLCMVIQAEWARCAATTLEEKTSDSSETEKDWEHADLNCWREQMQTTLSNVGVLSHSKPCKIVQTFKTKHCINVKTLLSIHS